MTAIPRTKAYAGAPLFSYGFRPFFLAGSLFGAAAIAAWLPIWFGNWSLPTALAPRDWHIHEMLFGFLPAVVTGFLLTAIPNWTGRLPLQGRPLVLLVSVWLAGRVAIACSALLPFAMVATVDLAFPALVIAAAAREVVAGGNWRNLRVVAIVVLLFIGDAVFLFEANRHGIADYGIRIGFSAVVLLVSLIGGRIIPSFTRNWLARRNPGTLPAAFGRLDMASILVSALALLLWIVAPETLATGVALFAAAALQGVRLARWAGYRTWRDPLVLVLHAAYLFVPLGFLLAGASALAIVPVSAAVHAWSIGAFGLMTLAVMSRASLGHTGRPLVAGRVVQAAYILVIVAAAARIAAALAPAFSQNLLVAAAAAWVLGFLGFSIRYWRILAGPSARRG